MRSERGAILVQVSVAMVGLLAFGAFVTDYGVLWVSRRQAQNAADAAALAGAIQWLHDPDFDHARAAAKAVGETNKIFGVAPTINQGSGDSVDETEDISFPLCPPGEGEGTKACIRVNVYRNENAHDGVAADPLPTFFGGLFGMTMQGVKATATAQLSSGDEITCLLPFAVMDRWSDSYDDNVPPLGSPDYYPWDHILSPGTDGWSYNDDYQPTNGDTYVGPYTGNTGFTGWQLDRDYGKQFILKDGNGPGGGPNQFSSGWFSEIDLPNSTGSNAYSDNIKGCNQQPVGIAKEDQVCDAVDEKKGCMSVKTGGSVGPTVKHGIEVVYDYDPAAHWDAAAQGPDGHMGAVVGGDGMDSKRIRPLVVLDIADYMAQGCSGTGCIGKVANILGFFLEGVCGDPGYIPTMDAGMSCSNGDVVGRLVEIPGSSAQGGGTVETPASFVRVVRLVR